MAQFRKLDHVRTATIREQWKPVTANSGRRGLGGCESEGLIYKWFVKQE